MDSFYKTYCFTEETFSEPQLFEIQFCLSQCIVLGTELRWNVYLCVQYVIQASLYFLLAVLCTLLYYVTRLYYSVHEQWMLKAREKCCNLFIPSLLVIQGNFSPVHLKVLRFYCISYTAV